MKKHEQYKLSSRIIFLLGTSIISIIFVYVIIFSFQYRRYEEKLIAEENVKTLHSLDTSIEAVIKNVNEYSKMLIADSMVQEQMKSGDLLSDVAAQSELIKKVYSISQFSDYVDTIWLIDNRGQRLKVGLNSNVSTDVQAPSYEDLREPYGKFVIQRNNDGKIVSLSIVRSYNSLETFESLGVIGIDLNPDVYEKITNSAIDSEQPEQVAIINEKNEFIYFGGDVLKEEECLSDAQFFKDGKSELVVKKRVNGKRYLLSGVQNESSKWKILRYTPVSRRKSSEMVKFNIGLIAITGLMILGSAVIVSYMLTKPLQELIDAMGDSQDGKLTKVSSEPSLQEFKFLFRGYNSMVDQIELLIQGIIDKQRRIRQVEMNELQEQMKPHFLYNTLDSIQALAMMGESDKVCELVERLGDFYRKSVSGGRELLTIQEELQIASDYAEILRVRFGDSFEYLVSSDDECMNYEIPKLTIQPLVENSFNHGIRVKNNQYGQIIVCASVEDGELHISVRDNGDGIPQSVVDELAENMEPTKGKSLGLRGTIERLRLLYDEKFHYVIENDGCSVVHLYILVDALEVKKGES